MIISPFIMVLSLIILLATIVSAFSSGNKELDKQIIRVATAYFFPVFLLYGFCVSSGIYMIVSLFDKENKMRKYMFLSGVGPFAYYGGLFCADLLLFLITEFCFIIFTLVFKLQAYSSQMGGFILILSSFGMALIAFTYLFQHWFKNSESAFRFIGYIYLAFGLLLPFTFILFFGIVTRTVWGLYLGNAIIYFINPFYVLMEGVQNLMLVYIEEKYFPNQPIKYVHITKNLVATVATSTLTMIGQAFFYMGLVILKDHKDCNAFKKTGGNDGRMQPQLQVYTDVIEHEKEVKNPANNGNYYIKAVDLKKTYKSTNLQAVCGNTFGIKKGEIFGLLGPNGAGKSTTFSMLTLDEAKTAGECMVIQKRVEDVDVLAEGSYIGLCPQYNTLWDQLTVDESLNLVARMKGLNNADRDRNKQLILETLELTDFVDTAAKNLSGGNKRKLCCA